MILRYKIVQFVHKGSIRNSIRPYSWKEALNPLWWWVMKRVPRVKEECSAIALLGAFVAWDDLLFTHRKDGHNERVFKSLSEIQDWADKTGENILLRPHPHAHLDMILPFLPPDLIVRPNKD